MKSQKQKRERKNIWSNVLQAVLAWTKVSRRRRASKCQSLIKQVQLHLSVQKTRKEAIIRQSRADVAHLLQNGRYQQAQTRVQQLYKDKCLLSAYDQINQLCQCIVTNISHISKQSTAQCLPIEVGQAVSSLIFAASRCGDLPELNMLRHLFKEHYGCKFEITNVELLPGNLVNSQMKENLSVNSVPDDEKLKLINEIAKEYNIHLGFQDPGKSPNPHYQKAEVLDLEIQDNSSESDEGSLLVSELKPPRETESHYNGLDSKNTNRFSSQTKINKDEVPTGNHRASSSNTSSDGTPLIHEKSVVYLDDLEVNSSNQEAANGKLPPRSGDSCCTSTSSYGNVTKKPTKPNLRRKSVSPAMQFHRFSTGAPMNNEYDKTLLNDRRSFDSSIDKWIMQNGASPSHVHPKLPNYEDVVAKFTDLKIEHRQRKSFHC